MSHASSTRKAQQSRSTIMQEAMLAVAAMLELPRDRLGRLDVCSHPARERVRELAMRYGCAPARDYMDQCAKVLRAAEKAALNMPAGILKASPQRTGDKP